MQILGLIEGSFLNIPIWACHGSGGLPLKNVNLSVIHEDLHSWDNVGTRKNVGCFNPHIRNRKEQIAAKKAPERETQRRI